ncbi:DJ-1/PfpI family protein [Sphingobium sp. CCH11-B1]|uniref:DJ-1/PfpI family protein n=1 Tax=Sphingobium sp. CCH11-B1 TaxID=1768781 RepID=UPI00082B0CAD|nr:DJ-1/PfpI family protein [Sphingobium sp. CCH11-B1]MEA3389470.1 DJ-1/PfpI family protein [Pseudomonadota bacterium]
MRAAIMTFDGYNELDSFVALALLNRAAGWRAEIVSDKKRVISMNGVGIDNAALVEGLPDYDVVLIGSGVRTQAVAADAALMARIRLDPARQIIGAQCSGALLLARLGLLDDMPVCTDTTSRPFVEAAGAAVIEAPFHARGTIATAGGCMAAHYLAAWAIGMGSGAAAARGVIDYVAPVGEKAETVARVMGVVTPFLTPQEIVAI